MEELEKKNALLEEELVVLIEKNRVTLSCYEELREEIRKKSREEIVLEKRFAQKLVGIDENLFGSQSEQNESPEIRTRSITTRNGPIDIPEDDWRIIRVGTGPLATELYLRYTASVHGMNFEDNKYAVHGARGSVTTTHTILSKEETDILVHWVKENVGAAKEVQEVYNALKEKLLNEYPQTWKKNLGKMKSVKTLVGEALQNINAKMSGKYQERQQKKKNNRALKRNQRNQEDGNDKEEQPNAKIPRTDSEELETESDVIDLNIERRD